MPALTIYVPAGGVPSSYSLRTILDRSGIVGEPDGGCPAHTLIYYEGNRHNACNIRTWADRVYHAASRMACRYPTIAMSVVPSAELLKVGTIDLDSKRITVTGRDELAAWLDEPSDLDLELELS